MYKSIDSKIKGEIEYPISELKLNTCYKQNGETYPLCKGETNNQQCKDCNICEN